MGTITDAITFEMRSVNEGILVPELGAVRWGLSSTWAHGGLYSGGKLGGSGPVGLLAPSSEVTMGYWLKTDGGITDVQLAVAYVEDPATPGDWEQTAYVVIQPAEQMMELWLDDAGPTWVAPANWTKAASASLTGTKWQRRQNWMHIGIYVDFQILTTWSVYIDGIQALTYTAGSNWEWLTGPDVWALQEALSTGATQTYVDSLYIEDVTGEGDQVPKGYRIPMALADGAGSSAQWTPDAGSNYARVNEDATPDEDTTYVETATATQLDLYTFTDLTDGPADELPYWGYTIYAVFMQSYYRMVDDSEVTFASYDHYVWDGALSLTDGPFNNADDFDWHMVSSVFPLQPDGTAWNLIDFNAWTYGIESN